MKSKKKFLTVIIIVLILILLIPIPTRLKDGGSVKYKAILYEITDVKMLNPDTESENAYLEGITVEVLGMEIYNNVE